VGKERYFERNTKRPGRLEIQEKRVPGGEALNTVILGKGEEVE